MLKKQNLISHYLAKIRKFSISKLVNVLMCQLFFFQALENKKKRDGEPPRFCQLICQLANFSVHPRHI